MLETIKKIPYVWVAFSLLYVLLEIIFRAELLDVVSMARDNAEIIQLENTGRFLSSLGFAIFAISLFKIKPDYRNRTKALLVISTPLLFVLFFVGFSKAQSWVINSIANQVSPETKREMLLMNMLKESVFFQLQNENSSSTPDWPGSDLKVFLSFMPAMVLGDQDYEITEQNKINKLIISTLQNKVTQNKKHSDQDVLYFTREWMKNVRINYSAVIHPSGNYTGFKDSELEDIFEIVRSNLRPKMSEINAKAKASVAIGNKERLYYFHEHYVIEALEQAISELENRENFNHIFNTNMNYASAFLDKSYSNTDLQRHFLAADYPLGRLFAEKDVNNLLKYYNFGFDAKKLCSATPATKNSLIFILSKERSEVFSAYQHRDSKFIEKVQPELFYQLTGRYMKAPHGIRCDFSYERMGTMIASLRGHFEKYSPLYNSYKTRSFLESKNTIGQTEIARYAAGHYMNEILFKQKGELLLTHFDSLTEYYNFIFSTEYSSSRQFSNSIKRFFYLKLRDQFLETTKAAGLDFVPAIRAKAKARHGAGPSYFYEVPEIRQVFAKGMPFVMTGQGRFVETMEDFASLPERKKSQMRAFYIGEISKTQFSLVTDPSLFAKGQKYEMLGDSIAKGFIAPTFVLAISNLMIMLTVINILMKIVRPFSDLYAEIARYGTMIVFGLLPFVIKNDFLYQNLPSTEHSKIIRIANMTANTQRIYDRFHTENALVNGVYDYIKRVTRDRQSVQDKNNIIY